MTYVERLDLLVRQKCITPDLCNAYREIKKLLAREDTVKEVTEKAPYYESYYCPACGDYVEPNSNYCPNCAARMGWKILCEE